MKAFQKFCIVFIFLTFCIINAYSFPYDLEFKSGQETGPFAQGFSHLTDFKIIIKNMPINERNNYFVKFVISDSADVGIDSTIVDIKLSLIPYQLYAIWKDFECGNLPRDCWIRAMIIKSDTKEIVSLGDLRLCVSPFPFNIRLNNSDSLKTLNYKMRSLNTYSISYLLGQEDFSNKLKNLKIKFSVYDSKNQEIKVLATQNDQPKGDVILKIDSTDKIPFGSYLKINVNFKGAVEGGIDYDINLLISAPDINMYWGLEEEFLNPKNNFPLSGFKTNNMGSLQKTVSSSVSPEKRSFKITQIPWRAYKFKIFSVDKLGNEKEYTNMSRQPFLLDEELVTLFVTDWPLDCRIMRLAIYCEGLDEETPITKDFYVYGLPPYNLGPLFLINNLSKKEEIIAKGFIKRNPKNDSIPNIDQSLGNKPTFTVNTTPVSPIDSFQVIIYDTLNNKLEIFHYQGSSFPQFKQAIDVSNFSTTASKAEVRCFYNGGDPRGFPHSCQIKIQPPLPNIKASDNIFSDPVNRAEQQYYLINFTNINPDIKSIYYKLLYYADWTDYKIMDIDSIFKNTIPYSYWLKFNGTSSKISYNQTGDPNNLINSSVSVYFRTTSTEGGPLVSYLVLTSTGTPTDTIPIMELSIQKNGALKASVGYTNENNKRDVLNFLTPEKYNDGEWHHAVLTRENNIFKIYVDGELAADDEISKNAKNTINTTSTNKKLFLGYSLIQDTSRNNYFRGDLTDVGIWTKRMRKNIVGSFIYLDSLQNNSLIQSDSCVFYLTLNQSINDISKGKAFQFVQADGINSNSFHQETRLVGAGKKHTGITNLISDFTYDLLVGQINSKGEYSQNRIGTFKLIEPTIIIRSIPPGVSENRIKEFSILADEGYGPFSQIFNLFNTFELKHKSNHTDVLNLLSNGKGFSISFSIVDSSHKETAQKTNATIISKGNEPFSASADKQLDMSFASKGAFLKANLKNIAGGPALDVDILYPLKILEVPPSQIQGNFGPFTQSILPGVNQQVNNFIITTPSEFLDNVVVIAYDDQNNMLDTIPCSLSPHSKTTWIATYDMGKLLPPSSKIIVYIYKQDQLKDALSFISEIIPTRPPFLQGSDVDINDMKALGNGKYSFEYSRLIGDLTDYDGDKIAQLGSGDRVMGALFGGPNKKSITFPAKLTVPMEYDSVTNIFSIEEGAGKVEALATFFKDASMVNKVLLKLAGVAKKATKSFYKLAKEGKEMPEPLKSACMINFSSEVESETDIKMENNNLDVSHLTTKKIELGFENEMEDYIKEVKTASNIEKKAGSFSPLKPKFDIELGLAASVSANLKYGLDEKTNNWGPIGSVDINPKNKEENASFNISSSGLFVDLNVGATLLAGLAEVYFVISNSIDVAWGNTWNMEEIRDLQSNGYILSVGLKASVGWGIFKFWIVRPFMCAHPHRGDDIYPWYATALKTGLNLENNQPKYSAEMLSPKSFPHPRTDHKNGLTSISWLEQDLNSGFGSVKVAIKKNGEAQFGKPIDIEHNFNSLNRPTATIINDSIVAVVWEQSRINNMNLSSLNNPPTFKDIVLSQDIWVAVYDFKNEQFLFKDRIFDGDTSKLISIGEGQPLITSLDDNTAFISWLVLEEDQNDSRVLYSILKNDNGWKLSNSEMFFDTPGAETQLNLGNDGNGKAILAWISDERLIDSTTQKLMIAIYDYKNNDIRIETIDDNLKDNVNYNYIDFDVNGDYGGLVVATYHNKQGDNRQYETVDFYPYEKGILSKNKEIIHQDTAKHHILPQIAVSPNGNCLVTFNQIKHYVDSYNNYSLKTFYYQKNLKKPNLWGKLQYDKSLNPEKLIYKADAQFISNDTLVFVSNESIPFLNDYVYLDKNSTRIGAQNMNVAVRLISISDSITSIFPGEIFNKLNQNSYPILSIIPNPVKGLANIKILSDRQEYHTLELFDITGKKLENLGNGMLKMGENSIEADFSKYPNGIYFIGLTTANGMKTFKILIE